MWDSTSLLLFLKWFVPINLTFICFSGFMTVAFIHMQLWWFFSFFSSNGVHHMTERSRVWTQNIAQRFRANKHNIDIVTYLVFTSSLHRPDVACKRMWHYFIFSSSPPFLSFSLSVVSCLFFPFHFPHVSFSFLFPLMWAVAELCGCGLMDEPVSVMRAV